MGVTTYAEAGNSAFLELQGALHHRDDDQRDDIADQPVVSVDSA